MSRKFLATTFLCLLAITLNFQTKAQTNYVMYAGNGGMECFYDVMQLSNKSFLVVGYADNLDWIDTSVPRTQLSYSASIPNSLGSDRYGIILNVSEDLQQILHVVHFPQGAVEDIRFIKTNSEPYTTTGQLFISCNTADSDNNNGGYIIAKLNNNFINGVPNALDWVNVVWAKSGPKDYHPWDVNANGEIVYISGEAHGYDWSAIYALDENGQRKPMEHWRTHWLEDGTEWKGTPASANPFGTIDSVKYSGIALKIWGRCELRSWTEEEYNTILPDGNGGTKKGVWPADILFNSACDNNDPVSEGPGYTGYSSESCCPVWGGSSVCIDRRNGNIYIGMNMKSYFIAGNTPDFEPAVLAMDPEGEMMWWSRLYHEITPQGDTIESIPDQYIDALSIDYAHDKLVVGARVHGNNTENFWEGNTIAADPDAFGFQNQFTGVNGDIHLSWIGKLDLVDGTLTNSTYMGEMTDATGALGTSHPDPNLEGWPDPNTGWPNVNTTRMSRNAMKVSSTGEVALMAVGRRTITTANAYQKMVKPENGGHSCWNSFVRVYDSQFHVPLYSSLMVGQWDTLTQAGGDNTEMFGLFKTQYGVVCVGKQTAESGQADGYDLPIINVPDWATSTPNNESAILVYYQAENLENEGDGFSVGVEDVAYNADPELLVYPNPTSNQIRLLFNDEKWNRRKWNYRLIDACGVEVRKGSVSNDVIDVSQLSDGCYYLQLFSHQATITKKLMVRN